MKLWGLGSLRCKLLGVEGVEGNIRPLDTGGVAGVWLVSTEAGTEDAVVLDPGTEMLPPSCMSLNSV